MEQRVLGKGICLKGYVSGFWGLGFGQITFGRIVTDCLNGLGELSIFSGLPRRLVLQAD